MSRSRSVMRTTSAPRFSSPRSTWKVNGPKRIDLDGRRRRLRAAPQDAGDAQQQLARLEGLGEIVVGADLEPADAVRHLRARGQHEDRHRRGLPQRLGEFEPALARHHHVDDQEVEGDAGELPARLGGRGGGGDAEAVARRGSASAACGCACRRRRRGDAARRRAGDRACERGCLRSSLALLARRAAPPSAAPAR